MERTPRPSAGRRRAGRTALAVACAGIVALSLSACQPGDTRGGGRKGSDGQPAAVGDAKPGPDKKPNGVEQLSAKEAYDKGTQATAELGSLRERRTGNKERSDLRLSARECVGTVSVADQGTFQIVRVIKPDRSDADTWVKVDQEMSQWAKDEAGTALPVNVWMHGSDTNSMMAALSSYCHHEVLVPKAPDGEVTKGEITTMAGQKALPVTVKDGKSSKTHYFATEGPARMLQVDASNSGHEAEFIYSDYGAPVGAKKPAGKVVEAPTG